MILSRKERLQAARRAFWNRELEASEQAYLGLISASPGDGTAYGELGNLYQCMGEPDRAREAYFQAAVRFKAAGEVEKLNEIIAVLKRQGDKRVVELVP